MKAAGGQENQGSVNKFMSPLKRKHTNFSGKTFPRSLFWENLLFRVFQGGKIKELFTIVSQPIWK